MITLIEVQEIHNILIEQFGGGAGVRDMALLEAAIARPYATFGEIDLYPDAVEKAAAILESILINHPFIDGNKRTGYVLMELMIIEGNKTIVATEDEKYAMVISVSTGELRFDEIKTWLIENVK